MRFGKYQPTRASTHPPIPLDGEVRFAPSRAATSLRGGAGPHGHRHQDQPDRVHANPTPRDRRAQAAHKTGTDRQTLRGWALRFNEGGIDAPIARKPPSPEPKLTPEQSEERRWIVLKGPDPKVHKVIGWRCVDLRAGVARRFSVTGDEFTVGRWSHKMRLTRLQPPPSHPRKDAAAQEALKNGCSSLRELLLRPWSGLPVEIWFQDEARAGQKGSRGYVWAPIGSRPPMVRDNRHDNAYIVGAIFPERPVGAAINTPAVNAECMSLHLAEINAQVKPGVIGVVLCDVVGWHATGWALRVPGNIVLFPLPHYSPELNSMENVWAYLCANKPSAGV